MLRARRRPLCEGSNAIDVSELNTATTSKGMNTMLDFRSSWIQPTKIHRRSLLAAVASIAAGLTIALRSDGAEIFDAEEVARRSVRPSRDVTARSLNNQVLGTIDLKTLGPEHQVASIASFADSYRVTTVSGREISFTEFDLRFKTDSSAHGPTEGHPVLLPASVRADRAFVVFASLREISAFVDRPA